MTALGSERVETASVECKNYSRGMVFRMAENSQDSLKVIRNF